MFTKPETVGSGTGKAGYQTTLSSSAISSGVGKYFAFRDPFGYSITAHTA